MTDYYVDNFIDVNGFYENRILTDIYLSLSNQVKDRDN